MRGFGAGDGNRAGVVRLDAMRALLTDYQGRVIRFPEERWEHIIIRHRDMEPIPYTIPETLLDPDFVLRDPIDPAEGRLYYRWYNWENASDKWVMVSVKMLVGDAYVLTAMQTHRPKRSEILWTKSNV